MEEDLFLAESLLNASILIIDDIKFKMEEDWNFFEKKTRKEAIEMHNYLVVLQQIVRIITRIVNIENKEA